MHALTPRTTAGTITTAANQLRIRRGRVADWACHMLIHLPNRFTRFSHLTASSLREADDTGAVVAPGPDTSTDRISPKAAQTVIVFHARR
ncbi:hypothetical protein JCM12141A_34450 [Mycolicibacterium hodleri]